MVMNGIYRNCRYNLPARYHVSVVIQVVIWSEPEHDKTIKMTCVPSDSDQPEYPPSDQSAQYGVLYGKLMTQTFFMQTAKALIRLGRCPGADLSLHWAHRSFCWFCHALAHFISHPGWNLIQKSTLQYRIFLLYGSVTIITVNFLNIRTPKKIVVITLKLL